MGTLAIGDPVVVLGEEEEDAISDGGLDRDRRPSSSPATRSTPIRSSAARAPGPATQPSVE